MAPVVLPLVEKIKAYAIAFLLVLVIYFVIDLYVPIKKLVLGRPLSWSELVEQFQVQRKLPFVLIIGWFLGKRGVEKKQEKLQGTNRNQPTSPSNPA